ncbi:hypothetical protein I4P42_10960 [Enterobacter roggenkampii]|uniref:hypothetical protein n=1 Tax=Enterobacter roggenkampii TaxID=1812935 RepID=UPI0018C2E74E|nr:hypothetical protein [Enterobacter roggenkampii]MBG0695513.1 hypothetical protein [Enterobacter roggenkampii]
MKKITVGLLLVLSYSCFAATEQTATVQRNKVNVENKNSLSVAQAVDIYRVNARNTSAIKKTISEIEKTGFATSTANLNDLENIQNGTIVIFKPSRTGLRFTPSVLSKALQKNVRIESRSRLEGVMPERLYTQTNDFSLSVINTARGKFDNGSVVLNQFINANNKGKEIATNNKVGLPEKGAILNIIKIQPETYVMVLTTI